MNERWLQVEQIYHAALERDSEERAAFLTEACDGDAGLRGEVESLLKYERQAEHFIESPALEVAAKMMAEENVASVVAGQTIKHYQIISLLGAGGMGEVYVAEDRRLGRNVAIKFLPANFTQDRRHLRRFEREARTVAALSHPNVCMIHEVIETGEGRHCIVMEYVEGATLRERIAEGRLKVDEVLDAAIQIASALAAAHAAGIVHRDIKPENIMLRHDSYVKILDFGLAKLTEEKSQPLDSKGETRVMELRTSPGVVMGTVSYMSPEQARGLPVDARTDVWSLGVVLYEMVTGQKPFQGATSTDVIIAIAEREPAPLATHVPETPIQLERIVKKALAKDREARYQTAKDLLIDLKSLKHELAVGAEIERFKQPTSSFEPQATKSNRQAITSRFLPPGVNRNLVVLTAIVGVLIIAALVAGSFYRQRSTPTLQTEVRSLAVLPLENRSGDSSQEYFADGMTDALITDLAKMGKLRVISRESVMQYKGTLRPLPEIGRELSVDAVLTGSVVRSGQQVRIAAQLVHVATERNLWSGSYERELRDVLALQREVTLDVVGKIRTKLAPQDHVQSSSVRSVNPEAYDHYLRGRFYLYRQNREDSEAAIASLEKAVSADPEFAAAHAELAQAYAWKLFLFAPDDKRWAEKAFIESQKALDLDPESAVAHLARGRILWTPANRFPHEKAIGEYRRALTLNPSLDEARNQLALVYCHIGAFEEALQESRAAITTNPSNNLAQLRIGQTLNFQGKYEEALASLRSIPTEVNPTLIGYQTAWALFNLGRKEEAAALLEQLLRDSPEDTGGVFTSVQAVLAASAGHEGIAEEKIASSIEKGKGFGHFHHTAYHIACAYALMNKREHAVKWLEVAAEDGFPCYALFEKDPNLNNLRQDAGFVKFLAKVKQQWDHYQTIL